MENLMQRVCFSLAFAATVLLMSLPAKAATVNITRTEVGVGLSYIAGWGPTVLRDSGTAVADGIDPAIVTLGGEFWGYFPPDTLNIVVIGMQASGSVAYNDQPGSAPSIFGTTSINMAMSTRNRGVATGYAESHENYVFYEIAVDDGPVTFSLSYRNEGWGSFGITNSLGAYELFVGTSGDHIRTLDPGIYRLNMVSSLITTETTAFGSNQSTFAITFGEGTELIPPLPPVPEPGSALLLAMGLAGLGGWRWRQASRR
jgi:hypothetical protein